MTFNRIGPKTPTSIGNVIVHLAITASGVVSKTFEVEVLDADGDRMRSITGDLNTHLTANQNNTINTFLGNLRTQATNEIL